MAETQLPPGLPAAHVTNLSLDGVGVSLCRDPVLLHEVIFSNLKSKRMKVLK